MDASINFTVSELIQIILGIAGAITAVAAAVGVIVALVKKAKYPNQYQNERLDQIEKTLDNHAKLFDNDNKRLRSIEEGNKVTQKALLALLAHGIDGNDIESMKKAKDDLQKYLIEK